MVFKKEYTPWNKGQSADPNNPNYDPRVEKNVQGLINKNKYDHAPGWNKGLTKETDPRLAEYGRKVSKTRRERKIAPWNEGLSADPDSPNYDPRVAKYVNAHIGKPSGTLGKTWKWSNESRARLSKRMMGKIPWNKDLTKETDPRVAKSGDTLSKRINNDPRLLEIRSKNGKANKGRKAWNKGLTKDTDPRVAKYADKLTGIPKTPEHREKIRRMRLAQPPEERTRIGRIGGLASMAKLTPAERSERALNAFLSIPKTNTSIELMLQEQLDNRGILYTTQVPLLGITAVDIFIKPNICIYADGNYPHKYPEGRQIDRIKTKTLEDNGYKVFRFWGSEIRKDPDQCVSKILEFVKKWRNDG